MSRKDALEWRKSHGRRANFRFFVPPESLLSADDSSSDEVNQVHQASVSKHELADVPDTVSSTESRSNKTSSKSEENLTYLHILTFTMALFLSDFLN